MQHIHCSYCGHAFDPAQTFPRTCQACQQITYINPIPVAVVLLPVDDGLLILQRGIPPQIGKWALPGGFMDFGETWPQACVRELYEETGISISSETISLFEVHSPPDGKLVLIFGLAPAMKMAELPEFVPNDEVLAWTILKEFEPLAFPLHTLVAKTFFEKYLNKQ